MVPSPAPQPLSPAPQPSAPTALPPPSPTRASSPPSPSLNPPTLSWGQARYLELHQANPQTAQRAQRIVRNALHRLNDMPRVPAGQHAAAALTAVGLVDFAPYGFRDIAVLGDRCIRQLHADPTTLTSPFSERFIDLAIGVFYFDPLITPENLELILLHAAALDFFTSGALHTEAHLARPAPSIQPRPALVTP